MDFKKTRICTGRIKTTVMMNLLERLHETHNLKTPDQIILDRNDDPLSLRRWKKTMEIELSC